jgi:hypothetical protein
VPRIRTPAIVAEDLHPHLELPWTERLSREDAVRAIFASTKGNLLKQLRVLLARMPTLMLDIAFDFDGWINLH